MPRRNDLKEFVLLTIPAVFAMVMDTQASSFPFAYFYTKCMIACYAAIFLFLYLGCWFTEKSFLHDCVERACSLNEEERLNWLLTVRRDCGLSFLIKLIHAIEQHPIG